MIAVNQNLGWSLENWMGMDAFIRKGSGMCLLPTSTIHGGPKTRKRGEGSLSVTPQSSQHSACRVGKKWNQRCRFFILIGGAERSVHWGGGAKFFLGLGEHGHNPTSPRFRFFPRISATLFCKKVMIAFKKSLKNTKITKYWRGLSPELRIMGTRQPRPTP